MKKRLINDNLITGIDVLNTLNGGSIEPSVKFSKFPSYHQIELKAPGIAEEGLHVKIDNDLLTVFYEHQIESRGVAIPLPRIVYNKQIPFFVDAAKINAHYAEDRLVVQLPFNEMASGYHRDVEIEN
ncbi:MAG: hypothetical protein DI538_01595 [Azospira oryzae]|jgi:hypothetical protein|nr:hypothetical protein [Cytophaga sp.]PZR41329.1 MAG: hypothetical protein DI538_01595 [Azospira oryzae]